MCVQNDRHGELSLLDCDAEIVFLLPVSLTDIPDDQVDEVLVFPDGLDELSRIFPCVIKEVIEAQILIQI